MKTKLGIYGGTFAPVHNAHVRMAKEFKKQMELDRLLIVPASVPPHKQLTFNDSPKQRLEMLKLVFDKEEYRNMGIEVSDYELTKPGKSYTVDTLRHFYSEDTDLYLLCGTDMLLTFHQWKDPDIISGLCTLVFAKREDSTPELEERISKQTDFLKDKFGFRIKELDLPAMVLSSTFIRENIHKDLSDHLPPEVLKYIKANNLYHS